MDDWDKRLDLAKNGKFCITEFEPVFDAATAMKAGKDLFIQRSNVSFLIHTNIIAHPKNNFTNISPF